jgi:3-methyladenine DNA glycosylase AlkD
MAQETAVEWLLENIQKVHKMDWDIVFVQAMMMEKEQIIEAYNKGNMGSELANIYAEKYYIKTYNK